MTDRIVSVTFYKLALAFHFNLKKNLLLYQYYIKLNRCFPYVHIPLKLGRFSQSYLQHWSMISRSFWGHLSGIFCICSSSNITLRLANFDMICWSFISPEKCCKVLWNVYEQQHKPNALHMYNSLNILNKYSWFNFIAYKCIHEELIFTWERISVFVHFVSQVSTYFKNCDSKAVTPTLNANRMHAYRQENVPCL